MPTFEHELQKLNSSQRAAVNKLDGPLLVLAGPGTGKTQLLSMRVANILQKNDILPSNILCLTFTDNAARNMRERLASIIGQPAYHVAIHTFHSFGSDIINQYPDYFTGRQLIQQVDELGRYELLQKIFETLPHKNPLSTKIGNNFVFLKDTLDVISWLKRNGLKPSELNEVLVANNKFLDGIASEIAETFDATPSTKLLVDYNKFLKKAQTQIKDQTLFGFSDYATELAVSLEQAIDETDPKGRYAKAITAWRRTWCMKNAGGKQILKDSGQSYQRMLAVTNVYDELVKAMSSQGLYDFDDMVVEAVHAMENNQELRYNLQERYQYILVDEFQDTNKAQLRMLTTLGDNPIHEGKPNIMVVGDDDQAIYAFQGAESSNMAIFVRNYGVEPIMLTENYRSNTNILELSETLADQLTDRLVANKKLSSHIKHKTNTLKYHSFPSELAQYDWIASEVEKLVDNGTNPENIAVIAPRHRYLERLTPYLGTRGLPIAYERRENVLEAPIVIELLAMARLVVALSENRQDEADELFSQVLGFDFWNLPVEDLVDVSLQCYKNHKHWLEILSKHKNKKLKQITDWFVMLARRSRQEPMEYMIDQLTGSTEINPDSEYDALKLTKTKDGKFISPLRKYYFGIDRYDNSTETYLTLLGQLATLRHRLRLWQPNRVLYTKDLVEFADLHTSAGLKIADTNPHTQTTNAVQVMTVYKAKGLEFDAVFVINAQDEVWGPTARKKSSRISLPRNLPIEPAGDNDNDRLRLLYVALTRARHTLRITGYSHTLENKLSPPLSFLEDSSLKIQKINKPTPKYAEEILATDWVYRFRQIIADKPTLLEPILANYKLSVTHLNNFIDVKDGGPQYFLVHNLLRFPEALAPSAAYGDAIHKALQWAHAELKRNGKLPHINKIQAYFSDMLARKHLRKNDQTKHDKRGREALQRYLKAKPSTLLAEDLVERGFHNEGVVVAGANLSGNIDKLHFKSPGNVEVIDFKTGKPAASWQGKDEFEKIKLYKYRQQLLFYKLLVEGSASFGRKTRVSSGSLAFIEPNDQDKLLDDLTLEFEAKDLERFKMLINAVWEHITQLHFPDISQYPKNLKGITQFEEDLLNKKI